MKRENLISIVIGVVWFVLAAISFLYLSLPIPYEGEIEHVSLKIKIYIVNAEGLPISGNITICNAETLDIYERGNFTNGQYLTRLYYRSGSRLKFIVAFDNATFNATRTLPEPKEFVDLIRPPYIPPENYLPDYFVISLMVNSGENP